MPTAWRLVRSSHAAQAFDGEGAWLYPGRWNSPGIRMVYTADSPALAALDILIQIHGEPPDDRYVLIAATFPERTVTRLDPGELPQGWATYPAAPPLRILGDTWIARNTSLVLAVPSAVIPEQHNFLINPRHPDFPSLKIAVPRAFTFDPRLFPPRPPLP